MLLIGFLCAGAQLSPVMAQPAITDIQGNADAQNPGGVGEADAKQAKKPPGPRDIELLTKDRVVIHCRYYPSHLGQNAIPLILIHGWNGPLGAGSGPDLYALATELQLAGYAVAVPDLRGHGKSVHRLTGQDTQASIVREQFRPSDLRDMLLDIEAVRSFLVDENNQKRLNLQLLGVVGFELGTVIAMNWTDYDWDVPSFPTLKQGQDVQALVLVSPEQAFRGVAIQPALTNEAIRQRLSMMVIYGKGAPGADAGKRLHNTLQRSRRPMTTRGGDAERFRNLFLVELDTSLAGSRLLDNAALGVSRQIAEFFQRRLRAQQEDFPWRDRSLKK
jgi:pimeloyl-ACP methyl ester carboxylesterase